MQLGKVVRPGRQSVTTNALVVLFVLVVVILAVGALDLAVGTVMGA